MPPKSTAAEVPSPSPSPLPARLADPSSRPQKKPASTAGKAPASKKPAGKAPAKKAVKKTAAADGEKKKKRKVLGIPLGCLNS